MGAGQGIRPAAEVKWQSRTGLKGHPCDGTIG
jgi:hypothetical protein